MDFHRIDRGGAFVSRYIIYEQGDTEVVVGWDNPLATFFAHVYDNSRDAELLAGVGQEPNEVLTIEALKGWLQEHGDFAMPRDVVASLEIDLARHGEWEPGPLQRTLGFTGTLPEKTSE